MPAELPFTRLCIVVGLLLIAASARPRASGQATRGRPQFVLMSMDTTPHWERRGFERLYHFLNASRPESPRSYTLFIGTGGLQFDPRARSRSADEAPFVGQLPLHNPVFDYAESLGQIRGKIENIRRLHELGVEIGSHTVRHERGADWDRARWDFEFDDHARILRLAGLPQPLGFRAPFLETNDAMYASLAAHGYRYDASRTADAHRWPRRYTGTNLWLFGIPCVHLEGDPRPLIYFDLNMENVLRGAAVAAGVQGEDAIVAWMDRTYVELGMREFERRYRGNRAPFLISGHGGFRAAISRLMRRICGRPDVRCSTFRDAVEYLDAHPELSGQ